MNNENKVEQKAEQPLLPAACKFPTLRQDSNPRQHITGAYALWKSGKEFTILPWRNEFAGKPFKRRKSRHKMCSRSSLKLKINLHTMCLRLKVVLYKYSITFHLGLTAEVKDRRWEDHH